MEQNEVPRYSTILYEVKRELDISFTEYILLDMVTKLQIRTGYCYKSPLLMADDLGISKRGINKMITRLIERKLLMRVNNEHALRTTDTFINALTQTGNFVPTKHAKGGNKVPAGGNSTTPSGNSTTKKQGTRITKNNNRINKENLEKYRQMKAKQFGVDTWQM